MTTPPDDRGMEVVVRSWLYEEDERPADRDRQIGRIIGRIDETPQRRRGWSLFPFRRSGGTVDEGDDDLMPLGGGMALHRARVAPGLMAAIALIALIATSFAFYGNRPVAGPGAIPSPTASPSPSPDPADVALLELQRDIWSSPVVDPALVGEIYAPDAQHTALWTDSVERIKGTEDIARRIAEADPVDAAGSVPERLPDGPAGEHRYLGGAERNFGIACAFTIVAARITRHDCILPMAQGSAAPELEPPSASAAVERETFMATFASSLGADREAFDSVVDPDVVHYVAWDNHATRHVGRDELWTVFTGAPTTLAPAIDLPAPAGEARWTNYSSVGGGTLCTFWTRERRLIRLDCIVPTSMVLVPGAEEKQSSASPSP